MFIHSFYWLEKTRATINFRGTNLKISRHSGLFSSKQSIAPTQCLQLKSLVLLIHMTTLFFKKILAGIWNYYLINSTYFQLTSAPSSDFFKTETTSSWCATSLTDFGRLKIKIKYIKQKMKSPKFFIWKWIIYSGLKMCKTIKLSAQVS